MLQTTSRSIRIFFNLSRFKNFPLHRYRIQIEFACSHASDGIRIQSGETRPTRCAAILVYCSVREWTGFAMSSDSKISGFSYFFHLWRADSKISRFAAEFAGCVWTEAVSEKKKLQIQKYPGTCGRGFKSWSFACIGLSDLYVRFWKPLTYKKCQCWIGHFLSKEQRKMNCSGVF